MCVYIYGVCVCVCVYIHIQLGFPGGSVVKNLLANIGDMCSIPGSGKSPGEGNGNPLQYSSLGNPIRERSLMGYHPWDHKKVRHDSATKQQHNNGVCIHTHTYIYGKVSACNAGSLGWKDPLEKKTATPSVFLSGKSYGQRSLVSYSPWNCKELDTTEQLTLLLSYMYIFVCVCVCV